MTAAGSWQADWCDDDRHARAALSFLADPGDADLGRLLRSLSPAEIVTAIMSGRDAVLARGTTPGTPADLGTGRAFERWRGRLPDLPRRGWLTAWQGSGYRLACPGDPEWPTQLDDLGDARPVILWLCGAVDLRFAACLGVGGRLRAASAYGSHVGAELAAGWRPWLDGYLAAPSSTRARIRAPGRWQLPVLSGERARLRAPRPHRLFG
jgi:DNA processing protein